VPTVPVSLGAVARDGHDGPSAVGENQTRQVVHAMSRDSEIFRAAQLLVREHGEDSMILAARQADKLEDQGDIEGSLVWRRIIEVLDEFRRAPQEQPAASLQLKV